ncbi:MAG: CaiB/BaiF CoA-transferase family protein [Azospirillaceae bacterium]
MTSPDSLLGGVRVIEFGTNITGPLCGYLLALLGADVIKIERPPSGDPVRNSGVDPELKAQAMGTSFLYANAGKRSIALDIGKPEGNAIARTLAKGAAILIENGKAGSMDRLGLGYGDLSAVNPGLIYCSISGYGQVGPYRGVAAYDHIMQGAAGMMSVTGTEETGPLKAGFPVVDFVSGQGAAFACVSALANRAVTGRGRWLDVSMFHTALFSMNVVTSGALATGRQPRSTGNRALSGSPGSGLFKTRDGTLMVAANTREQLRQLCSAIERPDLVAEATTVEFDPNNIDRSAIAGQFADAFLQRDARDWERMLGDAGVPAAAVRTVPEALEHPQLVERPLFHEMTVDGVAHPLNILSAPFAVDGLPPRPSSPPPRLGEHTDEILGELGLPPESITRLRDAAVVA